MPGHSPTVRWSFPVGSFHYAVLRLSCFSRSQLVPIMLVRLLMMLGRLGGWAEFPAERV